MKGIQADGPDEGDELFNFQYDTWEKRLPYNEPIETEPNIDDDHYDGPMVQEYEDGSQDSPTIN